MLFGMQYTSEPSTLEHAREVESSLRVLDGNVHHGVKSVWKDGECLYYAYAVFLCDENTPVLDGCRRVVIPSNLGSIVNNARKRMEEIAA